MRRVLLLVLLISACASSAGHPAPRVAAQTFEGTAVDIGAPSSKPTLIVFWATWCASCRLEMPKLTNLSKEHGDVVEVLGVNVDTDVEVAKHFVADAKLPYVNVSDPKLVVADAYGASQTPTLVLVDKQGVELARAHDFESVVAHLDGISP